MRRSWQAGVQEERKREERARRAVIERKAREMKEGRAQRMIARAWRDFAASDCRERRHGAARAIQAWVREWQSQRRAREEEERRRREDEVRSGWCDVGAIRR